MKPTKLGLTRNRLFETENCVVLCARFAQAPDGQELNKALAMLAAKHPILTAAVTLDGGTAVVTPDKVKPQAEPVNENGEDAAQALQREGLNFWEQLFTFRLAADSTLLAAGHTAVCDVKTLVLLTGELLAFYDRRTLDIAEAELHLFSDETELPLSVFSPLIDKTAGSLNYDWVKSPRDFAPEDYAVAKAEYTQSAPAVKTVEYVLNEEETTQLTEYCAEAKIDVATAVAYAFYRALGKTVKLKPNENAVLWNADRRVFFGPDNAFDVGAYDGAVSVKLAKRQKGTPVQAMQHDAYQKLTSCFSAFYGDVFGMKLLPALADASHLFAAGALRNKAAKRTALHYGCMDKRLFSYTFLNFDLAYWNNRLPDADLTPLPAFPQRTPYRLTAMRQAGKLRLIFSARDGDAGFDAAETAVEALKTTNL